MQPETIYVAGATARALWDAWDAALAARCDHELACNLIGGGCDTKRRHCLVGLDLAEVEQAASRAYHEQAEVAEVAA